MVLVIAVVIMLIAAVYVTMAADNLGNYPFKDQDPMLRAAYKYLVWATVLTWVAVGLIVLIGIGLVALAIFFPEFLLGAAKYSSSFIQIGMILGLIIAGGLALIDGFLGALAAFKIAYSGLIGDTLLKEPYRDAIIAAVAGIGGTFFIAGALILMLVAERACKHKKKK